MSTLKSAALAIAIGAVFTTGSALAYEAGDIIARAGWAHVAPDTDSDEFSNFPGAKAEVDDTDSLGLTFSYLFTDNIGVGVLAAYPFETDIEGDGTISAVEKVGDTKFLPPTVTLQYHFNTGSNFHPYIGAGINYTYFWDEDTSDAPFNGSDLDLDNSWGFAGEAGLDYTFKNDYLVSAQVWYIDIETTADSSGAAGNPALAGKADVDIDPWVFMLGVGKKF
ncbi:MAG: outer membrane beta-barrel protein [Gammaproteobacteria bacterium]|nr:outer membrane beta-barrel protein [Gammaproteobacteria bacterium]